MHTFVCLVVLSVVAVGTLAMDPEMLKEMSAASETCKMSESASDDDLATLRKHMAPTSAAGKCMVGCVFEKMGFMENGSFSRRLADEKANKCPTLVSKPEILAKVIQSNADCEKEIGSITDRCETGVRILGCLDKVNKLMGM